MVTSTCSRQLERQRIAVHLVTASADIRPFTLPTRLSAAIDAGDIDDGDRWCRAHASASWTIWEARARGPVTRAPARESGRFLWHPYDRDNDGDLDVAGID
jgi:hypothetical protein